MFSKKIATLICIVLLVAITIISLSITSRQRYSSYYGLEQIGIVVAAPFQKMFTRSIRFARDIWSQYFSIVNAAQENMQLKLSLRKEAERHNFCKEIEISNVRLRSLLNFKRSMTHKVLPAEVIGRDPSQWFKTVIIDKGERDNLRRGLPVVIAEGAIGQIIEVLNNYSKVLLLIDQNSAVDALVQRTRARGVIKGENNKGCIFKYVLRKSDVRIGDTIVSSGLDGVFPKGLRLGRVSKVVYKDASIFQQITVSPYVDFEKLEEVLVLLISHKTEF
jgi:rod shape-determining protein MreC